MTPKLKMVAPNHNKHKLVRHDASSLIKILKSIPTWKTADEDDEGAKDCDTSGALTLMAPFPPSISRTGGDIATSRLLTTWMSLIPLSKWGLSAKDASLDLGTGLFCTVKWNSVHGLALPPLLEGKNWDHSIDCYWACTRDQLIWPFRQVSLGGITSLKLWRKGNCEAQTSWCCLETELNTCAKIQAEFPTHLETALSQNVMNVEKQITHLRYRDNASLRIRYRKEYQPGQLLRWEMSCSVSRVAWAAAPTPVWKSERLITLPVGRSQRDVVRWSRGPLQDG